MCIATVLYCGHFALCKCCYSVVERLRVNLLVQTFQRRIDPLQTLDSKHSAQIIQLGLADDKIGRFNI